MSGPPWGAATRTSKTEPSCSRSTDSYGSSRDARENEWPQIEVLAQNFDPVRVTGEEAGSKRFTIVVYEREPGGRFTVGCGTPTSPWGEEGGLERRSLGHRDREAAKAYALQQAGKLRKGDAETQRGEVTLT